MLDQSNQTESDRQVALDMEAYFDQSLGTNIDKLQNFPKFVTRQSLSLFLAKHELFQRVVGVHGHVLECGVFLGGGLMTWAQLSAIYEPYNHVRRIIGFDTFAVSGSCTPRIKAAMLVMPRRAGWRPMPATTFAGRSVFMI